MRILSLLTLVSFVVFSSINSLASASWAEAKDDYKYEDLRLRYGNLPHDQTLLVVPEYTRPDKFIDLPNISFHTEIGAEPLLEIREGRRLYKKGELECIRSKWRETYPGTYWHIYFAQMSAEEYELYKLEKNTAPPRPCPLEGLVFGSAGVGYYSINETSNYEIVVDEFNGEWGKINNVFDDGAPLYVRIPKEERHHFYVNISRHQAIELARAHFPKFDETIKNFSTCLKDEKSVCNADLRQVFLADDPDYYEYQKLPFYLRPDLSKLPPISEDIRKLAQERMEIARAELIKFLDGGAKEIHKYYEAGFRICRGSEVSLCLSYGFYLKEVDTVINFFIYSDRYSLSRINSGTFIDVAYSTLHEQLDSQGPYSKRIRHVLPHSMVHGPLHLVNVYPEIVFLRFHAHGLENPYFSVKPRESLKEMGIVLESENTNKEEQKSKPKVEPTK
jgi:hypothetical protein